MSNSFSDLYFNEKLYYCSLNSVLCNLGGVALRYFLIIISSAVQNFALMNWWNLSMAKATANSPFTIWTYLTTASVINLMRMWLDYHPAEGLSQAQILKHHSLQLLIFSSHHGF